MSRYNKKTVVEYNKTRGNWIGFTDFAIQMVKSWNNDSYDAIQRKFEQQTLCEANINFVQILGMFYFTLLCLHNLILGFYIVLKH